MLVTTSWLNRMIWNWFLICKNIVVWFSCIGYPLHQQDSDCKSRFKTVSRCLEPINHSMTDPTVHPSLFRRGSKFFFARLRGSWTAEEWRSHRNASKLRRPAITQSRRPPIKCKCLFMCLCGLVDGYRCSDISSRQLTCCHIFWKWNYMGKFSFHFGFSIYF